MPILVLVTTHHCYTICMSKNVILIPDALHYELASFDPNNINNFLDKLSKRFCAIESYIVVNYYYILRPATRHNRD